MPTLRAVALAALSIAACSAADSNGDDDNAAAGTGGMSASPGVQGSGGQSHGGSGNDSGGSVAPMAGGGGSGGQAPACKPAECPNSAHDAGTKPAPTDDAGIDGGDGTGTGVPTPNPKYLVPATGPCPDFKNGYAMFHPDGVDRRALLFISDAANTLDGPLIFSWHTTLPGPESANLWLGDAQIEAIKAQGGIVAAPETGYPNETRPWDSIPEGPANQDGDQRLMDEIVACAISGVGIDVRRIHSIGMSAGGLKTAQVSMRRSGYIASVVVYSGGFVEGDDPPDQDPSNPFAAMILYGGASDISPVDGIDYQAASDRYRDALEASGRFAFLCDHGGGHSVPSDSQVSAWQFMQDHPFGTKPSPYATKLPDGFLSYCSLDL